MGAKGALSWLVGVLASMRPAGMALWGVWRGMVDICLDACAP